MLVSRKCDYTLKILFTRLVLLSTLIFVKRSLVISSVIGKFVLLHSNVPINTSRR